MIIDDLKIVPKGLVQPDNPNVDRKGTYQPLNSVYPTSHQGSKRQDGVMPKNK